MAEENKRKANEERMRELNDAKQHADGFQSTRMMKEVARPGIVDEFKGFGEDSLKQYNEFLQKQILEAQEKRARAR